jgi:hypothetical protein
MVGSQAQNLQCTQWCFSDDTHLLNSRVAAQAPRVQVILWPSQ